MRIFAINRFYRPDHSATSQMLTDLAQYLAASGADVHIVTSRGLYEGGQRLGSREYVGGVHVRRIWTSRFGRTWLPGRMCDYATFYLSAFLALVTTLRSGDLLIAKTDPPLISVVAAFACKLKGAVLVNWCQDLFPEVAAALGLKWAAKWPGAALRRLRNWSLKAATLNVAVHERMAEELERAGLTRETIIVLPNWADRDIKPLTHAANTRRSDWRLQDRVVFGYSGNLGRAHMPEKVADLVKRTSDIPGLAWLFIGGGHGYEALKRATAGLDNIFFKPYQPRKDLSATLSVPDIHLVSLDPQCEGFIVPSKLYGVLAAGRPVLFMGDSDGAVARDIRQINAGWVLDPEQPASWRSTVARLLEQPGARPCAGIEWTALGSESTALSKWSDALNRSVAGRPIRSDSLIRERRVL